MTPMTPMPEPQTEAGKALLEALDAPAGIAVSVHYLVQLTVPAIEAQARDAALDEALAAVRDYEFSHEGNYGPTDAIAAIRALSRGGAA